MQVVVLAHLAVGCWMVSLSHHPLFFLSNLIVLHLFLMVGLMIPFILIAFLSQYTTTILILPLLRNMPAKIFSRIIDYAG